MYLSCGGGERKEGVPDRKEEPDRKEDGEGVREWYVRLENLYLNDSCVGYKRIITYDNSDLMDRILAYYSLPLSLRSRMRIWSSPFRMRRLDLLPRIPEDDLFLSVYFY